MVKFINWWGQPTEGVIQDSWFENFFQRCCEDYEDADHNKINIYSVFGNMNAISSSNKSEANLFFTGENTFNMHRTFNNENFISQHVDIITGFFKSTSKSIRFPLWMIYWRFDLNGLFSPKISETRSEDAIIISNHTANGLRTRGVEIIKSLGIKVYCNRSDVFPMAISVKVLPNSVGKIETLKNYKYNICFENSLQEGYTTEKIFEALAGGTIPIYFGNNPVEPNILYDDNIVNIQTLSSNTSLLNKRFDITKVWKPEALIYIYSTYLKVWNILRKKLNINLLKKDGLEFVIYKCETVDECIEKLKYHWLKYNNFYTPRAKFILNTDTIIKKELYMEDLSDDLYNKYNL